MDLPDLELLRAFAVFAEHLNFTRAARALHLSQPALHARVAQLGDVLGVTLYRRRGRALELTADGLRVAAFARESEGRAREFVRELHGEADRQTVVLCAGAGSYLYLLDEALRRWFARPPAPLRLITRDREGTLDAVRAGEAHLGVSLVDAAPDDLAVDRLAAVPQVLALRDDHPLTARHAVTLADLDAVPMVAPPPERPHRRALDEALALRGARCVVAVETVGWEVTLRFVELGVGVAVVNAFCRLPPGVIARPMPELPARSYGVVRRRGARLSPAHEALRTALLDTCAAWR